MGAMTVYIAKPNLNNNLKVKEFATAKAACAYLLELTGYKMPAQDWMILGKLISKET